MCKGMTEKSLTLQSCQMALSLVSERLGLSYFIESGYYIWNQHLFYRFERFFFPQIKLSGV